jgi:hypothetical protein
VESQSPPGTKAGATRSKEGMGLRSEGGGLGSALMGGMKSKSSGAGSGAASPSVSASPSDSRAASNSSSATSSSSPGKPKAKPKVGKDMLKRAIGDRVKFLQEQFLSEESRKDAASGAFTGGSMLGTTKMGGLLDGLFQAAESRIEQKRKRAKCQTVCKINICYPVTATGQEPLDKLVLDHPYLFRNRFSLRQILLTGQVKDLVFYPELRTLYDFEREIAPLLLPPKSRKEGKRGSTGSGAAAKRRASVGPGAGMVGGMSGMSGPGNREFEMILIYLL